MTNEKSFGQLAKEEADKAMADMNDILDKPVRDEDWGVIHAIANHAKKPKEVVAKQIREMPPGTVFCEDLVARSIFVKTPDNRLDQVNVYVTRLEKALIKNVEVSAKYKKEFEKLEQRYEAMYQETFLGQASEFMRRAGKFFGLVE